MLDDQFASRLVDFLDQTIAQRRGLIGCCLMSTMVVLGKSRQAEGEHEGEQQTHGDSF